MAKKEPMYLILSTKHPGGSYAVWWRAEAAGYCCAVEDAGRFTRQQIEDKPAYYNDGITTFAIPERVAMSQTRMVVPLECTPAIMERRLVPASFYSIRKRTDPTKWWSCKFSDWTKRKAATVFTVGERSSLALPIDGEWVDEWIDTPTSKATAAEENREA